MTKRFILPCALAMVAALTNPASAENWSVGQAAWTNPRAACVTPDLLRDAVQAQSTNDLAWFRNHSRECIILESDLRAEVFDVRADAVGVKVRRSSSSRWIRLYTTLDGIWPCTPGFC